MEKNKLLHEGKETSGSDLPGPDGRGGGGAGLRPGRRSGLQPEGPL